jgi:hypothetical protein
MIKVKRPRVRIFMGRVRIISMGLKKAFRTPRIAAAKNALEKPLTWMPYNMYEATMIAAVKTSHLTSIPFISITSFEHYLTRDRLVINRLIKRCFLLFLNPKLRSAGPIHQVAAGVAQIPNLQ